MPIKMTITLILILTGCGAWPQAFQAATDIADDTAIKVEVSKEALQRDPNLRISVQLDNKDVKAP